MFSELILLHRPGGKGYAELSELLGGQNVPAFFWQTCLRQIAVFDESHLPQLREHLTSADEVYHGDAAYRFLLQVICGLHSPMVGETEVYGQFKNAVATAQLPISPLSLVLKRFFKSLFEDAKRIRQAHLSDLGSQTYGSVLRREVKGLKSLHIIGAGQFVQDILPWIRKDGIEIHVHARDVQKARAAMPDDVVVHALTETPSLCAADAVIIAAPITASWLSGWMPTDVQVKLIADLRADSSADRISSSARVLELAQIFERISSNQTQLAARKASALAMVEASVHERNAHVEYRPFGWEDVCA